MCLRFGPRHMVINALGVLTIHTVPQFLAGILVGYSCASDLAPDMRYKCVWRFDERTVRLFAPAVEHFLGYLRAYISLVSRGGLD